MDFKNIIEEDYKYSVDFGENSKTRLGYLAEHLFEFFAYTPRICESMVKTALDICKAINDGTCCQYVNISDAREKDFAVFMHTEFFVSRTSWGSIRGADWDKEFTKDGITIPGSISLYDPKTGNQTHDLANDVFSVDDWKLLIQAAIDFASVEYVAGSETHRTVDEKPINYNTFN